MEGFDPVIFCVLRTVFLISFFVCSVGTAIASPSPSSLWQLHADSSLQVVHGDRLSEGFLFPNEFHLDSKLHIWESTTNPGAYISVGTERSFLGASLSKSDTLITIDRNPLVTKFNHMNTLLLASSTSPDDYLYLRLKAPLQEVQRRLKQLKLASTTTPEDWTWWRNLHNADNWQELFFDNNPPESIKRFRNLAYWNDNSKWLHLKDMALNGRMGFFTVNFQDLENLRKLTTSIKELGITVSIIDTSNVLEYIGVESMAQALETFKDLSSSPQINPVKWVYTQLKSETQFYGSSYTTTASSSVDSDTWIFNSSALTFTLDSLRETILNSMRNFPRGNRNFRCERFLDNF